ncbi:MAG: PAS domain S-box protein [Polyangiales bacterium]
MRAELLSALRDVARLEALHNTELLDSPQEERFDRYTSLATRLLGTPAALISLVDDRRQFFKSQVGLAEPWASRRGTPLSHSFCKHAVASREEFVVNDARSHPLVRDNLAIDELGVQAYAGIPLEVGGQTIGAFCTVDSEPHKWTEAELEVMRTLASSVSAEIELTSTRRELQEHRAMIHAITESSLDVIVTADAAGNVVFANKALESVFRRAPEALLGQPIALLMPERYRAAHEARIARVSAGATPSFVGKVLEISGLRADGSEFPIELSISFWMGRAGGFYTAMIRDATERTRTMRKLRQAEEELSLTFDCAPIGMALAALDGHWLRVNDAFCAITGYSRDALLASDSQSITHPDDLEADLALVKQLLAGEIPSYQLQKRYVHRDGHTVWISLSVALVHGDEDTSSFFVAQVQDITERLELEQQIRQASLVDELTGLQNRRGFMLLAEQQLCTSGRYARPLVVLFADLNGMKAINDELGHEQGDRVLVDMAEVLRTTFRGADILARLGGDEFVILAEGDVAFAELAKSRLQENVRRHNETAGRPYTLSVAVGCALYDAAHAKSLAELLSSADKLMYDAKRKLRVDRGSVSQG